MQLRSFVLPVAISLPWIAAIHGGCAAETPTTAQVENGYGGAIQDGKPETVVYRLWYGTTLFLDPVRAGSVSEIERIVPMNEYAYAVLARGWEPSAGSKPNQLIAVRSARKLLAQRGETLAIQVSVAAFDGDCGAGEPLEQDTADWITTRIFPAEFGDVHYDAATCTASPLEVGGGGNGGAGGAP